MEGVVVDELLPKGEELINTISALKLGKGQLERDLS